MRTRNGGTPKSTPVKKTPPTRKSTAKNQTPPPEPPTLESLAEIKRASTSRGKLKKTEESTPTSTPSTTAVESPDAKVSTGGKATKTVTRRASVRKTPASRGGKRGQKVAETEVSKVEDEELTEQQQDEDVNNVEFSTENEKGMEPKDEMILEVIENVKFSAEMKLKDDNNEECQKNDINSLEILVDKENIGGDRNEECSHDVKYVEKLSKEDMVVIGVTESLETTEIVKRILEEERNVDKEMEKCTRDVISTNKGETSDINVHDSFDEEEIVAENVQEYIEQKEVVIENVHETIEEKEVFVKNIHESIDVEEIVAENGHEYIEGETIIAESLHASIAGEEIVTAKVYESIEKGDVVAENVKVEKVVSENIHEFIKGMEGVASNVHVAEKEIFYENVNRNEKAPTGSFELAECEHHDIMDVDVSGNDQAMAERFDEQTEEEKSADKTGSLNSSKDKELDSHTQDMEEEQEKLEEESTSEDKILNKNNTISIVDNFKEMKSDYDGDLANGCPDEDMLGKKQEDLDAKNVDTPTVDDVADHDEETDHVEEECVQLTDVAEERKIRKKLEIFVGGLDCEAHEDDVKKVFEQIGEVVDVQLHKKDTSNDKSKCYAFVRFATKEQASRALSELENPLICGKKCETAPYEDNNTLFLGNICNKWTKEAINQKLKEYEIESVLNLKLVSDPRREGFSRGFAFLEFPCHGEAILAYKRLQKSDVTFGHAERSVKVAFAERLRKPDPEVLARVKSVFVDGVPPVWDEENVREYFKSYGEIIRITLSKNITTAKRKDFAFVDYSSHEAAVACVDDINNKELGNMKVKVQVSLSNPMPKPQAVKSGMYGGFKIDRHDTGSSSKTGRGFERGGYALNRSTFQHGTGFSPRGRGQFGRTGFTAQQHGIGVQRPPFLERQMTGRGGGWGAPSHISSGGGAAHHNFEGLSHNATSRGGGQPINRRPPFSSEGGYPTSHRRPFEEPRSFNDNARGMKRPHFMTEPDYMEPNRVRPRFDYSAPSVGPFQGIHQRDTFGASGSGPSQDYYSNSNYGQGAYRPPYGGEIRPPYGGEIRTPYVNARPPFREGSRPYGGRNYYY